MRLLYASIVLFSTLILSSCGLFRPTDFSLIKIGMTTDEVKEKIGKPRRIAAAKRYENGILEVYEYSLIKAKPDTLVNWLYFIDNRLEEWGPKEQYIRSDHDKYYQKYRNNRR